MKLLGNLESIELKCNVFKEKTSSFIVSILFKLKAELRLKLSILLCSIIVF